MTENGFTVTVGPPDANGKRKVTATLCGKKVTDKFDADDAFRRSKFRERCITKFGLNDDGDIHEAIEAKLIRAAEASDTGSALFKPVVTMLDTVAVKKVEWLWPNRFAIGKLNLLCGDPGLAKSLLSLDIAARVTRGVGFPDAHDVPQPVGGVIILTNEDDTEDTLAPRLLAHDADLSRIGHIEGKTEIDGDGKTIHGIDLSYDIALLSDAIDQVNNCRLVIVDPITEYLGRIDSHKTSEVRGLLSPFAQLARDRHVAILAITHFRKSEGRAVHQPMGSLGFVAAARTAWAVTRCPTNPKRRLMTCIKNNLADDTTGLAYTVEPYGADGDPVICWEREPIRMSADEAMAVKRRGPAPEEQEEAANWLRKQLADGPRPAKDILDEATDAGFNQRTLRRALDRIGGQREKRGFSEGWLWRLPEGDTEGAVGRNLSPSHLRKNTEENTHSKRTNSALPAKGPSCLGGDPFADRHEYNGDDVPF